MRENNASVKVRHRLVPDFLRGTEMESSYAKRRKFATDSSTVVNFFTVLRGGALFRKGGKEIACITRSVSILYHGYNLLQHSK